jgi:hypothetical protein
MTTGTEPTLTETVERTDQELAAKLRGQLDAVAKTLTEITLREFSVSVALHSDDTGTWFHRETISKTVYL